MKYTAEVYDGSLAQEYETGEYSTFDEAAAACIEKAKAINLWPSVTGRTSLDVSDEDERVWTMREGETRWVQTYGPAPVEVAA